MTDVSVGEAGNGVLALIPRTHRVQWRQLHVWQTKVFVRYFALDGIEKYEIKDYVLLLRF